MCFLVDPFCLKIHRLHPFLSIFINYSTNEGRAPLHMPELRTLVVSRYPSLMGSHIPISQARQKQLFILRSQHDTLHLKKAKGLRNCTLPPPPPRASYVPLYILRVFITISLLHTVNVRETLLYFYRCTKLSSHTRPA